MDLIKREDVLKIVKDCKERNEIKNLPHYNPVSQMDKLKSELSEILEDYEHKKEPQKIHIGTNWKKHDDLLDAYRYAKASVGIAEFEKAMKEAPKFVKPCEYPIRKFKVVAKGTLGLVDHYVYADDVSEDENGCHFWIDDKKVGHFTNAVAYYEVKKNESDTNRE